MRNNIRAFGLVALVMMTFTAPVWAATDPVTLSFPQGGHFRLTISATNPNMIFIPGDKIKAMTGPMGAMSDKRRSGFGGVMFSTTRTAPFTFYLETELGQVVAVTATPIKGDGKVYRLLSSDPVERPEVRKWESGQPYETLLIALNKAVLTRVMPEGYAPIEPLRDGINTPAGLSVSPLQAWSGHALRIDQYRVTNSHAYGVALREQDFWRKGVRAVMFEQRAQTLMAGASVSLLVVRAQQEASDAQH